MRRIIENAPKSLPRRASPASRERDVPHRAPHVPLSFHMMAKPRGSICNLDCSYCYYLEKEALYPGSAFRMSDATLEAYIRQYIASQMTSEVTFAWQGGEPALMGLDFFRRAVELQQKYARPGMRVANAFQTNGTMLDDEWCRFFREHDFLIGISIDGPRRLHDAHRKDKGGTDTFDRVMRGLRLLQKHGVEYNVLTTVHAANADHPLDVYRFLRDVARVRFIQFIPIVERVPATEGDEVRVSERSVHAVQYGRFLIRIFDEWVRKDIGRVFVQAFDEALGAYWGRGATLCVHQETCGKAMVIEHNGDVYSCDHFVEPAYRLGNIHEDRLQTLAGSAEQNAFGEAKRNTLPRQCLECDVRFACHGGCPKDRFIRMEDGEDGLNVLCEGYRAFFRHIREPMRLMIAELDAGRPPSNVMRTMKERLRP